MSRLSCLTIAVMFRICSSKSCLANRSPPPLFCILCRVETMSSLMRKACSTRAAVVFSWLRILSSSWSTRLADANGTAVNAWLCSAMFRTRLVKKNIQILLSSHTKLCNVFPLETVRSYLSSDTGRSTKVLAEREPTAINKWVLCWLLCVSCAKAGQALFPALWRSLQKHRILRIGH